MQENDNSYSDHIKFYYLECYSTSIEQYILQPYLLLNFLGHNNCISRMWSGLMCITSMTSKNTYSRKNRKVYKEELCHLYQQWAFLIQHGWNRTKSTMIPYQSKSREDIDGENWLPLLINNFESPQKSSCGLVTVSWYGLKWSHRRPNAWVHKVENALVVITSGSTVVQIYMVLKSISVNNADYWILLASNISKIHHT